MHFIAERYRIYLRRYIGQEKPWTEDPILQQYRFTNVFRELDKETVWIHSKWLNPSMHEHVWFAAVVARHINWSPTLAQLTFPVPWDPERFIREMKKAEQRGGQLFTGAYMINQSIPGGRGLPKYEYLARYAFKACWQNRDVLAPRPGDTLEYAHTKLLRVKGMGSFMAAQVIADVKHTWLLAHAPDWLTWAASGPGSRRGMNALLGLDDASPWREEDWRAKLAELLPVVQRAWPSAWPLIDAQNLQNCLCEFSKYHRGYSRAHYPGV